MYSRSAGTNFSSCSKRIWILINERAGIDLSGICVACPWQAYIASHSNAARQISITAGHVGSRPLPALSRYRQLWPQTPGCGSGTFDDKCSFACFRNSTFIPSICCFVLSTVTVTMGWGIYALGPFHQPRLTILESFKLPPMQPSPANERKNPSTGATAIVVIRMLKR